MIVTLAQAEIRHEALTEIAEQAWERFEAALRKVPGGIVTWRTYERATTSRRNEALSELRGLEYPRPELAALRKTYELASREAADAWSIVCDMREVAVSEEARGTW